MDINIIRYAIICVAILFSISLKAQIIGLDNSYVQESRVGLIDEFMKRFNGYEAHPDISPDDANFRKNNIISLFDFESFKSCNDSIVDEINNFIDIIITDTIKLNYEDSNWVALARCKGSLDGKSVYFNLYLTVQNRREDMFKWVIAKADGNIFNIGSESHDERIIINPDDHETKFISLSRICKEQPQNIELFMSKGFEYNPTSVFAYLVYSKRLKIDYIDNLSIQFMQVPGYIFNINYTERESSNTGWLITNFVKVDEEIKNSYLQSLLINTEQSAPMNERSTEIRESKEPSRDDTTINNRIDNVHLKRIKERIGLINDYIAYLADSRKDSKAKSFYRVKLNSLFNPDARLHIINQEDMQLAKIDTLFDVASEVGIDITIDSISIPDYRLLDILSEMNNNLYETTALIIDPELTRQAVEDSSQTLFFKKEDTEDGLEWLPIFGDIFITVNKK